MARTKGTSDDPDYNNPDENPKETNPKPSKSKSKSKKASLVEKLKLSLPNIGSSSRDKGKGKVDDSNPPPSPSRPSKKAKSSSLTIPGNPPPSTSASTPPLRKPQEVPVPYPFDANLSLTDEDHIRIYDHIRGNVVLPTLVPNLKDLEEMKVLEPVRTLMSKAGLGFLFEVEDEGCFTAIVDEFLCSFEALYEERPGGKVSISHWSFILGGTKFEISKSLLIRWFGFAKKAKNYELDTKDRDLFWSMLVGKNEYFVGNNVEQRIVEPKWKVIHRLVAENVVPRQETGRVTIEDINYMAMIYNGNPINMIKVLTAEFSSHRKLATNVKALGGGSFITHLAHKLNFTFRCSERRLMKELDIKQMVRYKMITKEHKWFVSNEIPPKAKSALKKRIREEGPPPKYWLVDDVVEEEDVAPSMDASQGEDDDVDHGDEDVTSHRSPPHHSPTFNRSLSYLDMYQGLTDRMNEFSITQRGLVDDVASIRRRQDELIDFTRSEASWHREEAAWQRATLMSLTEHFHIPPYSHTPTTFAYPPPPSSFAPPLYQFQSGPSDVNAGVESAPQPMGDVTMGGVGNNEEIPPFLSHVDFSGEGASGDDE